MKTYTTSQFSSSKLKKHQEVYRTMEQTVGSTQPNILFRMQIQMSRGSTVYGLDALTYSFLTNGFFSLPRSCLFACVFVCVGYLRWFHAMLLWWDRRISSIPYPPTQRWTHAPGSSYFPNIFTRGKTNTHQHSVKFQAFSFPELKIKYFKVARPHFLVCRKTI